MLILRRICRVEQYKIPKGYSAVCKRVVDFQSVFTGWVDSLWLTFTCQRHTFCDVSDLIGLYQVGLLCRCSVSSSCLFSWTCCEDLPVRPSYLDVFSSFSNPTESIQAHVIVGNRETLLLVSCLSANEHFVSGSVPIYHWHTVGTSQLLSPTTTEIRGPFFLVVSHPLTMMTIMEWEARDRIFISMKLNRRRRTQYMVMTRQGVNNLVCFRVCMSKWEIQSTKGLFYKQMRSALVTSTRWLNSPSRVMEFSHVLDHRCWLATGVVKADTCKLAMINHISGRAWTSNLRTICRVYHKHLTKGNSVFKREDW